LSKFKSKARWAGKVRELGTVILHIKELLVDGSVNEILDIAERWYTPFLQIHYTDDYPKRLQDIGQLKAVAAKYQSVEDMLADLALDPPEAGEAGETENRRVVLSTIHSAKGLEWKAVYIISMAEGRFPSPAALNDVDDIEEERRLFYVAATRAKDVLYFCYPTFINMAGSGLIPAHPCRFLEEIPSSLMTTWNKRGKGGKNLKQACREETRIAYDTEPDIPSADSDDKKTSDAFKPGTKVRHSAFGRGTVVQRVSKDKIKVLFDVGGIKTLHLGYAPLSVI
jgi:DNA helicase-2/ATP-dependent DNA helicase PcrA